MAELYEEVHEIKGTLADLPVLISFKHCYRVVPEADYGADADGRRGVKRTCLEDEDVTDIHVSIDGHESPVSELHPNSQAEINSQIAEFLETLEYE